MKRTKSTYWSTQMPIRNNEMKMSKFTTIEQNTKNSPKLQNQQIRDIKNIKQIINPQLNVGDQQQMDLQTLLYSDSSSISRHTLNNQPQQKQQQQYGIYRICQMGLELPQLDLNTSILMIQVKRGNCIEIRYKNGELAFEGVSLYFRKHKFYIFRGSQVLKSYNLLQIPFSMKSLYLYCIFIIEILHKYLAITDNPSNLKQQPIRQPLPNKKHPYCIIYTIPSSSQTIQIKINNPLLQQPSIQIQFNPQKGQTTTMRLESIQQLLDGHTKFHQCCSVQEYEDIVEVCCEFWYRNIGDL